MPKVRVQLSNGEEKTLFEFFPDEIIDNNYLRSIDGRFIAEAQYGDEITFFTERNISNNSFAHTIKTNNNKICATAITLWNGRVK